MTSGVEAWPAVAYEDVIWDVHPVSGMARQDTAMIGRPYRASVTPHIANRDIRLSGAVAALADDAATAIRSFDAEVGREIAPFAAVLLRSESAASSQIENLSASARRVAEAEVNGVGTDHAMHIVANVHAMQAALDLSENVDTDAVLTMHAALMRHSDPDIAGQWRTDQVWIGGRRTGPQTPHNADFVPPAAERVSGAMADLMAFAARQDLPVLAHAAVAHAQFETIHPFPDGNGRTGRALLHAMLRAKRLTRQVSVPISAGLLVDTRAYFDALTRYRDGDLETIVAQVARAALHGVQNGEQLVSDLTEVRAQWAEQLADLRSDAAARRLADELFRSPVVSASTVRELLGIGKNEHRHIEALASRGILKAHQDYKTRNMTWRADAVLDALDDYARRAGRRRR